MEKCEKCLYYKSKTKCGECGRLSNAMDNNPMFTPNTNYARIKSMSVEEMAEGIAALTGDLIVRDMMRGFVKNETAIELYKQWLLQEVSEDDTKRKES